MKLMLAYIRIHIKSLLMFVAFAGIFATVFFLYNLPLEPVLYSVALGAFMGLILFLIGFSRFARRHKAMEGMLGNIAVTLEDLPEPTTQTERDYVELIKAVFSEKSRAESEKSMAINNMTDYYTMWVHQIKTPIAAMRLLLQSGETDSAEMEEQLFRIEEYVEMVLTYLRCDYNETDYVFKRCELDSIVRGAVRKYAKQFIRKKISLDYSELNMSVITDEKWLSFVLEQLLSNSLKYTREGGITVKSDSGNTIIIEDTGIGISPEDLPRVCECGYTGYNGRADKKSTGIGLYLCKRILTGLGHTLEISSVVGQGTTIRIGFDTADRKYE